MAGCSAEVDACRQLVRDLVRHNASLALSLLDPGEDESALKLKEFLRKCTDDAARELLLETPKRMEDDARAGMVALLERVFHGTNVPKIDEDAIVSQAHGRLLGKDVDARDSVTFGLYKAAWFLSDCCAEEPTRRLLVAVECMRDLLLELGMLGATRNSIVRILDHNANVLRSFRQLLTAPSVDESARKCRESVQQLFKAVREYKDLREEDLDKCETLGKSVLHHGRMLLEGVLLKFAGSETDDEDNLAKQCDKLVANGRFVKSEGLLMRAVAQTGNWGSHARPRPDALSVLHHVECIRDTLHILFVEARPKLFTDELRHDIETVTGILRPLDVPRGAVGPFEDLKGQLTKADGAEHRDWEWHGTKVREHARHAADAVAVVSRILESDDTVHFAPADDPTEAELEKIGKLKIELVDPPALRMAIARVALCGDRFKDVVSKSPPKPSPSRAMPDEQLPREIRDAPRAEPERRGILGGRILIDPPEELLTLLDDHVRSRGARDDTVLWLHGEHGVGKTALVNRFVVKYGERNHIASHFFSDKGRAGKTGDEVVRQALYSVARQLSSLMDDYREALLHSIEGIELASLEMDDVIKKLIGKPFAENQDHAVIVLDALDEAGAGVAVEALESALAKAHEGPFGGDNRGRLRIIVTSTRGPSSSDAEGLKVENALISPRSRCQQGHVREVACAELKDWFEDTDERDAICEHAADQIRSRSGDTLLYVIFCIRMIRSRSVSLADLQSEVEEFPDGLTGWYGIYISRVFDKLSSDDNLVRAAEGCLNVVAALCPSEIKRDVLQTIVHHGWAADTSADADALACWGLDKPMTTTFGQVEDAMQSLETGDTSGDVLPLRFQRPLVDWLRSSDHAECRRGKTEGRQLNAHAVESLTNIAKTSQDFVRRSVRSLAQHGKLEVVRTILDLYADSDQFEQGEQVVSLMTKVGAPDCELLARFVCRVVDDGKHDDVATRLITEQHLRTEHPDNTTTSCQRMMEACARRGLANLVVEIHKQLPALKLSRNSETYSHVIDVWDRRDVAVEARKAFDEMYKEVDIKNATYAFNCMIRTYIHADQPDRGEEIFEMMVANRIPRDGYSYSRLITTYVDRRRTPGGPENIDRALGLFQRMRDDMAATDQADRFIGTASRPVPEVRDNMAARDEWDLAYTSGLLIRRLVDAEDVERARILFDSVRRYVRETHIYTAMIRGYAMRGEPDGADEILKMMRDEDIPLNGYTYEWAIRAHANAGRWYRADELLEQLRQDENVVERARGYVAMIRGCAIQKKNDRADEILRMMDDDDIPLNGYAYEWAIRTHANAGRWYRADELLEQLRQDENVVERARGYNAMIDAYARVKDGENAKRIFDMMAKDGVDRDAFSYGRTITALAGANLADQARAVLDAMRAAGVDKDARPYNDLITAFGNRGCTADAAVIYGMMVEDDVDRDSWTISALAGANLADQARAELDAMRAAGVILPPQLYNKLVEAFVDVGDRRSATELVERVMLPERIPLYRRARNALESNCRRGGSRRR